MIIEHTTGPRHWRIESDTNAGCLLKTKERKDGHWQSLEVYRSIEEAVAAVQNQLSTYPNLAPRGYAFSPAFSREKWSVLEE